MAHTKRPEKKKPTVKPAANGRSSNDNGKDKTRALKLVKGSGSTMLLSDGKTKANPKAMRQAAKVLGVRAPKTQGLQADQELLGELRMELGRRLAPLSQDQSIQCIVCKEISTDDTDFCPYCGDLGKVEEVAVPAEVVSGTPKGARLATPVPTSVPEEFRDADNLGADAGTETDNADSFADDPGHEDAAEGPDDEPDEVQIREARVSSRPPKPEPPAQASRRARGVGISSDAATPTRNVDAALAATARDLEARLGRIHDLKRAAVGLSYDIGIECKEIRDRQLFKARGYTSFREFAIKELPFTRESALQLITIVDKYTRDDYEQIGFTKLRVISAVSDSAIRQEMLEAAKQGASRAELQEARATGAPAATTARGTKAPPPEQGEKITLLGKIGARAQIMKFHDAGTGEVLESAGAFKSSNKGNVYGEIEISEDVFLRVGLRINPATKALEGLTVRFVRAREDEE